MHFPWTGGRHPCLDLLIETRTTLIGIELKRYEPFRSKKTGEMSGAYWRDVWGAEMGRYERCRDAIRDGQIKFARLDAVQLIKHAFGLRTAVNNVPKWKGKRPILLYLYSEPQRWPGAKGPVSSEHRMQHLSEIAAFAEMVKGDEVTFYSLSYSELLARWQASSDRQISAHAAAVIERFIC